MNAIGTTTVDDVIASVEAAIGRAKPDLMIGVHVMELQALLDEIRSVRAARDDLQASRIRLSHRAMNHVRIGSELTASLLLAELTGRTEKEGA